MQPVYDAGIGVYPCRGNHDAFGVKPAVDPTGALSKAGWDNVFTGPYALPGNGPSGEENITFSFTRENVFVLGLDNYGTHPPQGNGIGDVCDCEGDFNCDGNVDAADVGSFLNDFARNQYTPVPPGPCSNRSPCNGDFNCDGNVDSTDVKLFLSDFGRNQFNNPCPACNPEISWCVY